MTRVLYITPVPAVISAAGAQAADTAPPSAASIAPDTDAGVLTAVPDEPAESVGTGAVSDDA